MRYVLKHGASRASRKYDRPWSSINFPLLRYDGTIESLAARSKRPHSHSNQYTAIDEFSRLRYLGAYNEPGAYSSADFLKKATAFFQHCGFSMECVQTDNGFEFTNRFAQSNRVFVTFFEKTAADLGVRHKLIRPTRRATTATLNAAIVKINAASMIFTLSTRPQTSMHSQLGIEETPTTVQCVLCSIAHATLFSVSILSNKSDKPTKPLIPPEQTQLRWDNSYHAIKTYNPQIHAMKSPRFVENK